jgi:AcrR family transcriptional regulator
LTTENVGQGTVTADDERDSISTRERLLSGAAGLFREKGYAGTTTRALSALAGIQNGSMYHHVGGKEDLLYGLCVDSLNDVAALFASIADSGGEPVHRLERVAKSYVQLVLRDRDRHATMLSEIRSLSPQRREQVIGLRDENVAFVENLVLQSQERGQLRSDVPAKYLTLAMFNLLNWTIFWFDPEGELSVDQIATNLWLIFSSGVFGESAGGTAVGSLTPEEGE